MRITEYIAAIPQMRKEVEKTQDPILKLFLIHHLETIEEIAHIVEEDLVSLEERIIKQEINP